MADDGFAPPPPPMSTPSVPPPPPPMLEQVPVGPGGGSGRSSRSKFVIGGAVVAVLALGAAGTFAATKMSSSSEGGAATPEALGEAVMTSIDQEDVLGVIDLLLPGERDTFREPMVSMVSELTRLDVLSNKASLDQLAGVDLVLDNRKVTVETTNVSDITNITMTADLTATVDGEQLPVGKLITDNLGADQSIPSSPTSSSVFELPLTAVERDGRWYLSAFYSIAESARTSGDLGEIPATGVEPAGADSPEGAIDALLTGVEQLDLRAVIASLNPNEAEALQRYAPLFLDDAQRQLDSAPLTWQVTDTEYTVDGSGSTRSVGINKLRIDGTLKADEQFGTTADTTFTLQLTGTCVKFDSQGAGDPVAFDSCGGDTASEYQKALGAYPGLDDLRSKFGSALTDYKRPGITVKQVDGKWYVSPIASGFDQLLAFLRALDPDGLRQTVDALKDFSQNGLGNLLYGSDGGVTSDSAQGWSVAPETTVPSNDVPTSGPSSGTGDTSGAEQAFDTCVSLPSSAAAADCVKAGVAAGTIPAEYSPVELEFLQCGVGDAYVGVVDVTTLSDAEFTALLNTAHDCFSALIGEGAVDAGRVSAEYLRVECAEGRNPFTADPPGSSDFFDKWQTCVYG